MSLHVYVTIIVVATLCGRSTDAGKSAGEWISYCIATKPVPAGAVGVEVAAGTIIGSFAYQEKPLPAIFDLVILTGMISFPLGL
jgi:hypothetical protein